MKIFRDQLSIDSKEKPLFEYNITQKQYEKWYKEQMRRRRKSINLPIFDIDESFECGAMSLEHFREMMRFFGYKKIIY